MAKANWKRNLAAMLSMGMALCTGCADAPEEPAWRIAFEAHDLGRIASCAVDGSDLKFLTPETLHAEAPAADTLGGIIFFCGTPRSEPDGASAVYRMLPDGSDLTRLIELPFRASQLAAAPDGEYVLIQGHYPDDTFDRIYRHDLGQSVFRAVVPDTTPALDPEIAPTGLHFLYHAGVPGAQMAIGSASGGRALPAVGLTYSHVSFAPDGFSLVGVCGPRGRSLCHFDYRNQVESNVIEGTDDSGTLANPDYHPEGGSVVLERHREGSHPHARLVVLDLNSFETTELPEWDFSPRQPAWVR